MNEVGLHGIAIPEAAGLRLPTEDTFPGGTNVAHEQGDRWATVTGEALIRVAAHQPEPGGGCTCGFCAWSVEHVVQLVLNEAAHKCGYRLVEDRVDD